MEKIWAGFMDPNLHLMDGPEWQMYLAHCVETCNIDRDVLHDFQQTGVKKITTIRADEKNRWREGMDIHMVINNRTPSRFQFAPIVMVKSIQKIEIKYYRSVSIFEVRIDNRIFSIYDYKFGLYSTGPMLNKLFRQDGFDSIEDFMAFFPDDFSGIIIHWTDEQYCFNV